MRFSRLISTIDVHAGGEVGRVVTSGVLGLPGATMADKMRHINEVDDSLRRFLVTEPRASAAMTTNLLLAPTRPDADAAFLVLQVDRAHAMSGSNAMCVVTALLEAGMLPMREPDTVVRLDTPAGLVAARAACADGRCRGVSLERQCRDIAATACGCLGQRADNRVGRRSGLLPVETAGGEQAEGEREQEGNDMDPAHEGGV